MKDLAEFSARLKSERKRLGLKSSGIMESIEKMDSSDTIRYDVVIIPQRPRPKGEALLVSPTTPKSRVTIVERIARIMRLWRSGGTSDS